MSVDWRTRCDACMRLLPRDRIPHVMMSLPGRSNSFELCDECSQKMLVAADAVIEVRCQTCGHYRPEHNSSCLRADCQCDRFVPTLEREAVE